MVQRPLPAFLLVILVFTVSGASSAALFDTTDVVLHSSQSFDSRSGSPNPFDINLTATVTSPSGRVHLVRGFFDGDGSGGPAGNVFKIRINADETGTWRWTTSSDRSDLNGKTGTFTCSGTINGPFRDGPIVVDPDRRQVFRYREGRPVYLVGKFLDADAPDPLLYSQTMFSEELSDSDREGLFARHRGRGLNKMNVYLANKGDYEHISTTPWIGTAISNDKNRFDLGRWHLYEDWVRRMGDAGIVAQLWFFADDSGFGDLPDAQRKRLIQYGMARLSGYVNTVFTLVLEWQEGWTHAEVEIHAQYLQSNNPWDRLVSVHGIPGDFDFPDASWADYMDIQAGNDTSHQEVHAIGLLHRALADKPLIQEEFGLGEEDLPLRQKAWAAFTAGAASSGTGAFLKPLARYISTIRFERLEPSLTRVIGEGYAAEDPGRLYVVYLHGGEPVVLDLLGVQGPLQSEWFDPRREIFSPGPQVAGDGLRTVTPPDGQDWVLTLTAPPPPPTASSFYAVPPCRLLDTRSQAGSEAGAWLSGERRRLEVGGRCGIPATARAVAANVTAVDPAGQGRFTIWPVGGPAPMASIASFGTGQNRATSTLLPLGADGTVLAEPFVTGGGTVQMILDVSGYFE